MKEKILKILHVLGYISMALLTLIFVFVGVHSCNANNEQKSAFEKPRYNSVILTQRDRLYNQNDLVGSYKFNSYHTGDISLDTLVEVLEIFVENYNYVGEDYTEHSYSFRIYGYNNGVETQLTNNAYINSIKIDYATAIVKGFANDGVLIWEVDFSNENAYQYYSINMFFVYGDFYSTKDFFKYFTSGNWRYLNNEWKGTFKYIISPYITFSAYADNFELYFGFSFRGNTYYGISLNNGDFAFLGNNGNLVFNKKYSLNGKQVAYYYGDTTLSNHTIDVTSFGSLGYDWLETYLINQDNPIYNGTFYLNVNEIFNMIRLQDLPNTYTTSYPLTFYSGGDFFTDIFLNIMKFDNNPNEVLVRLSYSNYGVKEQVVIYRYFNLNEIKWADRETDVYNENLFAISLDNSYLNAENYPIFRNLYYLEYLKPQTPSNGSSGSYVGNVFVLLGDSFSSILPILNISIFPGLTIGVLVFIPLVISLVLFVVWLFKR